VDTTIKDKGVTTTAELIYIMKRWDNRKKRFLADSLIACAIILTGIIAAFIF
jgi:hypothetical protein